MIYFKTGSEKANLSNDDLKKGLFAALDKLGKKKKVLAIPPDITRFHSQAGLLTSFAFEYYKDKLTDVLPALGTHSPMTAGEIDCMFPGMPKELFRVHDWRKGVADIGTIHCTQVAALTGDLVNFDFPVQINRLLFTGDHDLVLSIGQVLPHEVVGMANYNKNILVGTGGKENINISHYTGALYGMENLLGVADNPVRRLLNYAADTFLRNFPIVYVHTVVSTDEKGEFIVRGLFIGDDEDVFRLAADLAKKVNITNVDKPLDKVVAFLDPANYKSTWLGNKAIYRTRMALADGGQLIVLAPGVKEFGEDTTIDKLIRKYGYAGTSVVLKAVQENEDLRNNLSAAAHLIHGSSEGRFTITYCPGNLTKKEIESVNYQYAPVAEMMKLYDPVKFKSGFNRMPNGETIYFIPNPGAGLWKALR